VPWCEHCAKFWTPSSMTTAGACPVCGRVLARPAEPVGEGDSRPGGDESTDAVTARPATLSGADLREMAGGDAKAPWHFKLMVVALALYLGWRAVQLVLLLFR